SLRIEGVASVITISKQKARKPSATKERVGKSDRLDPKVGFNPIRIIYYCSTAARRNAVPRPKNPAQPKGCSNLFQKSKSWLRPGSPCLSQLPELKVSPAREGWRPEA